MRPIEVKADLEFLQALRCVEHRIPDPCNFRGDGYLFAVALRYGLIGAAAAHDLLESADPAEERYIIGAIVSWPDMVEQHARFELWHRLPHNDPRDLPQFVARWSARPVRHCVPLFRSRYSLEGCLRLAMREFIAEHSDEIRKAYPWWQRSLALRDFCRLGRQSLRFALNFSERRRLGLDEVPEIALLDE